MKTWLLPLLAFLSVNLPAAEVAALPEPGPEAGGLRLRLIVVPRMEGGKERYDVGVDLLNTSESPVTLRTGWRNEDTGEVKDYLEAATSIECVPAIRRWLGGVYDGGRKLPQSEHVLKPGAVLSARWQTEGRRLKNRVSDPFEAQNPELPFPGLYSVHATVKVITSERVVALRSNEQLVPIGGSRAMPKSSFGHLSQVDIEADTALLDLGAWQQVRVGDRFEHTSKREHFIFTVCKVSPSHSTGILELVHPESVKSPVPDMEVTLIQKK